MFKINTMEEIKEEAKESDRSHSQQIALLKSMFPSVDSLAIEQVVNNGSHQLGVAIDTLLKYSEQSKPKSLSIMSKLCLFFSRKKKASLNLKSSEVYIFTNNKMKPISKQ